MAQEKDKDKEKPHYIRNLPVALLMDRTLTGDEFRYYVIIVSLSYSQGYCFMTNSRLGKMFGKSISTIQRIVSSLKEKGYAKVEIYVDDNGNTRRKIIPLVGVRMDDEGHINFDMGGSMDDMGGSMDDTPPISNLNMGACQICDHSNNNKSNDKSSNGANADLRNSTPSQKGKAKRKKFVPPSLDEVEQYVEEKGLAIDARRFFDFYTAGEWHDSGGKPVKNWKQKALTWDRREQKERRSQPPAQGPVHLTQADMERRDAEQRKQIDDSTARYRQKKRAEMQKGATSA